MYGVGWVGVHWEHWSGRKAFCIRHVLRIKRRILHRSLSELPTGDMTVTASQLLGDSSIPGETRMPSVYNLRSREHPITSCRLQSNLFFHPSPPSLLQLYRPTRILNRRTHPKNFSFLQNLNLCSITHLECLFTQQRHQVSPSTCTRFFDFRRW